MKAPNKIYLHGYPDKPFLCQDWDVAPTKRVVRGQQAENIAYIRKDMVVDAIKLAYGKVSMNPFDCSEAFEELLNKVGYEIH